MAPIGQIFVKFDIEGFYENLSGNSEICLKSESNLR